MNYRSLFLATGRAIILYVSGLLIPVLGQFFVLFTPVPLILAYVRDGRTTGLLAIAVASSLVTLLGWYAAALFLLSFGLMTIGISEGMLRKMKPELIALLGGLLPILVLTPILLSYLAQLGENPILVAERYLRESVLEASKRYAGAGLTEMATATASIPDVVYYYLVRLLPGIFLATMTSQAAFCYGIARAFIIRKQGMGTSEKSFALWHAPDSWVFGLIASLGLLILPDESTNLIGWNLTILFGALYLAQGIALADFFMRKLRMHGFVRALMLTIILFLPPLIAALVAVGVVDIWADLRKVRAQTEAT